MIIRLLAILLILSGTFSSFSQNLSYNAERTDPGIIVQVFPIPANDHVTVNLGTMKSSDVTLSLHNIIGNKMPLEIETTDEHAIHLKVKDLAPGYYFISVKNEKDRFRGAYKFLKS